MLTGQNIALVDEDSLQFTKLEIDGEDIRYNRKGDSNFKVGSFPKIDDDGEYALFDVELKSAPFCRIGSASIDGTIDVHMSDRLITAEQTDISIEKPFSLEVGPLTISNQSQPSTQPKDGLDELGEVLKESLTGVLTGNDDNTLRIYVTGNLDALVSLDTFEDDKELEAGWYTTGETERGLTFTAPTGSIVSFTVKYWNNLQTVTVPIKQ